MQADEGNFFLWGNAYAAYDGKLMLVSAMGAQTAIKGIRAGLCEDGLKVRFGWQHANGDAVYLDRHPGGYGCHVTKLNRFGKAHLVALARHEDFVPCLSEPALWKQLHRYTTPLLRRWMPWLAEQLKAKGYLLAANGGGTYEHCVGCEAGFLKMANEELDAMVSEGVRDGFLTI